VRDVLGHFYAAAGPLELTRYFILICYPLIGIYYLIKSYREANNRFIKRQALLIIIGLTFPLIIGSLTDELLPLYGIEIGSFLIASFLVMVVCIFYAIVRYKFGQISPALAVESTIASIPDSIIVTDIDGQIIYCNESAINLLKNPLINTNINSYYKLNINDRIQAFAHDAAELLKFDIDLLSGQGQFFAAEANCTKLKSATGEFHGLLWDIRDLSSDQKLKYDLNEQREQLNLKISELRRLNEFMSGREERLQELRNEHALYRSRLNLPPNP
jgi:hypothetical protein